MAQLNEQESGAALVVPFSNPRRKGSSFLLSFFFKIIVYSIVLVGQDFLNPHFTEEGGEAQRLDSLPRYAPREEVDAGTSLWKGG